MLPWRTLKLGCIHLFHIFLVTFSPGCQRVLILSPMLYYATRICFSTDHSKAIFQGTQTFFDFQIQLFLNSRVLLLDYKFAYFFSAFQGIFGSRIPLFLMLVSLHIYYIPLIYLITLHISGLSFMPITELPIDSFFINFQFITHKMILSLDLGSIVSLFFISLYCSSIFSLSLNLFYIHCTG